MTLEGWWSPSTSSTVFLFPYRSTNEYRVRSEYRIDFAYACWVSVRPARPIGRRSKIDPLPSRRHEMNGGIRVQGSWLDVVSISAKIGGRFPLASSRRCSASNAYWSGSGEKANLGPRYPRLSRSQTLS